MLLGSLLPSPVSAGSSEQSTKEQAGCFQGLGDSSMLPRGTGVMVVLKYTLQIHISHLLSLTREEERVGTREVSGAESSRPSSQVHPHLTKIQPSVLGARAEEPCPAIW